VRYCSRRCQAYHWKGGHNLRCKELASMRKRADRQAGHRGEWTRVHRRPLRYYLERHGNINCYRLCVHLGGRGDGGGGGGGGGERDEGGTGGDAADDSTGADDAGKGAGTGGHRAEGDDADENDGDGYALPGLDLASLDLHAVLASSARVVATELAFSVSIGLALPGSGGEGAELSLDLTFDPGEGINVKTATVEVDGRCLAWRLPFANPSGRPRVLGTRERATACLSFDELDPATLNRIACRTCNSRLVATRGPVHDSVRSGGGGGGSRSGGGVARETSDGDCGIGNSEPSSIHSSEDSTVHRGAVERAKILPSANWDEMCDSWFCCGGPGVQVGVESSSSKSIARGGYADHAPGGACCDVHDRGTRRKEDRGVGSIAQGGSSAMGEDTSVAGLVFVGTTHLVIDLGDLNTNAITIVGTTPDDGSLSVPGRGRQRQHAKAARVLAGRRTRTNFPRPRPSKGATREGRTWRRRAVEQVIDLAEEAPQRVQAQASQAVNAMVLTGGVGTVRCAGCSSPVGRLAAPSAAESPSASACASPPLPSGWVSLFKHRIVVEQPGAALSTFGTYSIGSLLGDAMLSTMEVTADRKFMLFVSDVAQLELVLQSSDTWARTHDEAAMRPSMKVLYRDVQRDGSDASVRASIAAGSRPISLDVLDLSEIRAMLSDSTRLLAPSCRAMGAYAVGVVWW
jgi:hypothetical protein